MEAEAEAEAKKNLKMEAEAEAVQKFGASTSLVTRGWTKLHLCIENEKMEKRKTQPPSKFDCGEVI